MKNRRFVFVMLLMLAMTSGAEEKSRQITVSLNQHDADYAKENNFPWTIQVSNVITGETVYTGEVNNYNGILDASQWKSGIYAVKSRIGDSAIVQKIAVK
jgi:hypothetical protein